MTHPTNCRWKFCRMAAIVAAFAIVLSATAPALATDLKWTFKAGKSHRYRLETKTTTELKLPGQTIKTTMLQATETSWNVRSVDEKGDAEIALKFERFQIQADTPQGRIAYDSLAEKPPGGLLGATIGPTYKALAGSTFVYNMTPQGEVRDIRIPGDVVARLKEAVETSGDAPRFSEEGYKELVRDQNLQFPARDLKQGDCWTRQTRIGSPTGVHLHEKTYTYAGLDEKTHAETIRMSVQVKLEPTSNPALDVKIDGQQDNATYLFDNQDGHLLESCRAQTSKVIYTLKAGPRGGQAYTENKTVESSLKLVETRTGTVASK